MVGRLLDYFHWDIFTVNSIALLTVASVYGMAFGTQCLCVFIISPRLCHPNDAKRAVTYLFGVLGIPAAVGSVLAG